jgi:DNA repair protein RecO (recombination protein O)
VIKEVVYKDNDKIITILTDNLGKISCMAKGAKKTSSPILANAQYLVYSEFVLTKGKSYYYVNSASVIDTFYKLRVDFNKLDQAFELTRILNSTTDENQDTSKILRLFLNTLYVIEHDKKPKELIEAIFKIKLLTLLGFSSAIEKCLKCNKKINYLEDGYIFFDYVSNVFLCKNCAIEDKKRYIKISKNTISAINYTILADIKKVFSFELKESTLKEYISFGRAYYDSLTSSI